MTMTQKTKNTILQHWRIYAALVALFVVVAGALIVSQIDFQSASAASHHATYAVHRRDLSVTVTESGDIKTLESTDVISDAEEMKTIVSIVPEGTIVTEKDVADGMILCLLDSSELQEELLLQQMEFVESHASFIEAQQDYQIQQKLNESNLSKSQLALRFAVLDMKKFFSESIADRIIRLEAEDENIEQFVATLIDEMTADPNDSRWGGSALQQKRKLQANIEIFLGQLEKDRNQLRGTQRLYDSGYVAFSELESDKLAFSRSQTNLQNARTALDLFMAYDFPKQSEKLASDYHEARKRLERTDSRNRSRMAQALSRLSSREVIYLKDKERLEKLRKELDACTIRATVPGLVIYGSSEDYLKKNSDPIEVGDGVERGQKIITIPNYDQMSVKIGIRESWVDRIEPGLEAKIVIDPFPDTVFGGKVKHVAPLPDSRSRYSSSSVRLYSTEVALEGSLGRIQPGMSARVQIIVEELKDVICVPIQAVSRNNGDKVCYVISENGVRQRIVQTGHFNEAFVEITEGLSEGELISLIPSRYADRSKEQTGDKPGPE